MIKFEYYEENDLTSEEIDSLWGQGVNLDDWDYMLFHEVEGAFEKIEWLDTHYFTTHLTANENTVGRLLTGCCSNEWYQVGNFKGRKGLLGVAYHA